jgi:thioredoxin-related protein
MFIPRFSLKWRKLRSLLEVTTNILVVLVVLGAVAIIARNYFASRRTESPSKIQVGTIFPAIPQIRVNQSRKTLILALSVHCRFCIQSIPLYHRLAEAARENKDSFSIVAIFLDKESELVSKFAEEHKLAILAIPTVDFASAKIAKTPTLVLVDNNSKVLESWVGQLPEDQEKDVFEALGVPYRERLEPLTTIASKDPDVEKTVDVFDENNALLRIEPQTTKEDLQKRFVTAFEVDSKGNVYLIDLNSLLIYDVQGGLIASIPLPDDFTSPFCIDDHG